MTVPKRISEAKIYINAVSQARDLKKGRCITETHAADQESHVQQAHLSPHGIGR